MTIDKYHPRRVTIFAGHYGSGKTNLAINFARWLKRSGEARVAIADLDIVNPYFRTKDSAAELAADGIELVVSQYANSNVDFPAMPKEIYALVADRDTRLVMDVGGDDRGALALGRYVPDLKVEANYEMLAVVNASRPLTRTSADTVEVLREIEQASGLPFTGVVNNTNLGADTRPTDVLSSLSYADEVATALGVAVRFTACRQSLISALSGRIEAVLPIDIQHLYYQLA